MTIYVYLLPPSNMPNNIDDHDDHFDFTYGLQFDFQSQTSRPPGRPIIEPVRVSSPEGFPAGPRSLLETDGQITPSSPSWTALATLLSHVKTSQNLSLDDDVVEWCPELLAPARTWTRVTDEGDLIRRVLDAARVALARRNPSSSFLCLKIRKVVTLPESEYERAVEERRRREVEEGVFESVSGMIDELKELGWYEEIFGDDVEAARGCWVEFSRTMGWDRVLDREGLGLVLGRIREWEFRKSGRAVNWVRVEAGSDGGECCSICLEGGGDKTRLSCNHTYHFQCIMKWMRQRRNCPTCRFKL